MKQSAPTALLLLSALLLSDTTRATPNDTVTLSATIAQQKDNNIFRLPDGIDPLRALGNARKGDTATVTQAAIQIDKPYSLQRFKLDINRANYRYQTFKFLDFSANQYNARWQWAVTPRITGNLSADRTQTLGNYADYSGTYGTANLRTTENRRIDTDIELTGNWHLLAAASRTQQRNTLYFETDGAYIQNDQEAGARYAFPSGSAITLIARSGKGHYTDRSPNPVSQFDSGFTQHRQEARLDWNLTGRSKINAQLGQLRRKHDHYAARNYRGTVGRMQYSLALSEKLNLALFASRDLAPYQSNSTSWYTNDTVGISPTWNLTPRMSLSANLTNNQRKFSGGLYPAPATATRTDRVKMHTLRLNWTPVDYATLTASLGSETRDAPLTGTGYSSHTANLSLTLSF